MNAGELQILKDYAVQNMQTAPPGMCAVSADVVHDMVERIAELEAEISALKIKLEVYRAACQSEKCSLDE